MDSLYHYCSSEAFHAIVASKTIRLSSLMLSNDSAEGKMVSASIARLAERDDLSRHDTDRLLSMVSGLEDFMSGLGFCLTQERDQLGQWRGYADDGAGVAIGFSKEYLEALQRHHDQPKVKIMQLEKVEYEPDAHDRHVEPTYLRIKELIDQGAFKFSGVRSLLDTRTDEEVEADRERTSKLMSEISIATFMLFTKLYLLKSPAFKEENEWRLISYHAVTSGVADIEFRPSGGRIIPFATVELADLDMPVINEVILGSKHITPAKLVEGFLERSGYSSVVVDRSASSYR